MLELKNIRKAYVTAGFTQVALDDVSVAFRDNEFVAVLGASGSGKTTMLNILGGLDHADSGDIVINGISTKDYTDKDWDTYRNHRIGFIFQSYNLIPHQTVLSNVELALTLAGISASERKERARAALERVGLGDHVNKRPAQLSGGQMQRVAIARALVNDPDIVLADEPTGALDTETGIQVMDLLKEIADERLVIMVTHNPELAEEYATRIVRLKDGHIIDDSDPVKAVPVAIPAGTTRTEKPKRHASMSFLTALALSFNNLMTKKGRTFMTAFAGSIGIIGIAAILALSNGVNGYIADTEEEALSSYPLTITKSSFDLTSMMMASVEADEESVEASEEAELQEAADTTSDQQVIPEYTIMSDMFARVKNNDLARFKTYLESGDSGIEPYVNTIQYTYGVTPLIYSSDTSGGVTRLNPSKMSQTMTNGIMGSSFVGGMTAGAFQELLADQHLLDKQAVVEVGRWPEAYDECVLVTTRGGWLSDYTLYSLGVHNTKDMEDMLTQALNGEDVEVPEIESTFTKDDALNLTFKVVPAVNLYQKHVDQGTWTDMTGDKAFMKKVVDNGITLKVVGIVHRADDATSSSLSEGIAYSPLLTEHLMELAAASDIVGEQIADHDVDVFTGKTFEELQNDDQNQLDMDSIFTVDEEKLQQAFQFDSSAFEGVGQGMDLSGLDLSSAFSGMDLSSMDFSQMDTSALASLFDSDSLGDLMGSMPAYTGQDMDLSGELSNLDIASKLAPRAGELVDGFASFLVDYLAGEEGDEPRELDIEALIEAYQQTDGAQAIIQGLVDTVAEDLGDGEAARAIIDSYFSEQFLPYLQQALADVDVTQLNEETIRQIIAQAPPLGLDALGEAISMEAITEATAGAANSLAADFAAWLLQNPSYLLGDDPEDPKSYGDLVNRYLETDSAKKIINDLMGGLGSEVSDTVVQAVNASLSNYMTTAGSAMSSALEEKMGAVTAELGKQLGQTFFAQLSDQMAQASQNVGAAIASQISASMAQMSSSMENAFSVDGNAFAEAIQFNMTQDDLASILSNYMNAEELSYDANLKKLGYATLADPESISIYPIDFPSKEAVLRIIDTYNDRVTADGDEDASIVYSDFAGVLMGSVTDIVNTISLVLIAFVSISLVVSSIMISIITYISVLERKKEIGILRAMGASKLNVANIFNAETVIEGFIAGVLAIAVVYAASVPVNAFILETRDVPNIMKLPWENALALVGVSVGLTLIAGLIPSSAAARRDPVEALRSE